MKKHVLTVAILLLSITAFSQTNTLSISQLGTTGSITPTQTLAPGALVGNDMIITQGGGALIILRQFHNLGTIITHLVFLMVSLRGITIPQQYHKTL